MFQQVKAGYNVKTGFRKCDLFKITSINVDTLFPQMLTEPDRGIDTTHLVTGFPGCGKELTGRTTNFQ